MSGSTEGMEVSSASGDNGGHREERRLEFPELPMIYFANPEELQRIPDYNVYLQPTVRNFPAIDALVVLDGKVYLFQATRYARHVIKEQLLKVLAHLPAHLEVDWVWVLLPSLCAPDRFNARKVPTFDGTGFEGEKARLIEKRLKAIEVQYRMAVKELKEIEPPPEAVGVLLKSAGKPQAKPQPPKKEAGRRRNNPVPPASAMLVQSSATCNTVGSRRAQV